MNTPAISKIALMLAMVNEACVCGVFASRFQFVDPVADEWTPGGESYVFLSDFDVR